MRAWLGWVAVIAIGALLGACTRSIHFPASQLDALRPLAGTPPAHTGGAEGVAVDAGQAIGVVDPGTQVVLAGREVVAVDAETELTLRLGSPEDEIEFRPGWLVFAPTELWMTPNGSLRVPYPRVTGLTLEKPSFGRTVLWLSLIALGVLLTLVIVGVAVGGDGSGGDGDDWD